MKNQNDKWYLGAGIRHSDTIGICRQWHDGEESGEETIAEVLPGEGRTAKADAERITSAVNAHDSLVAALEQIASRLSKGLATNDASGAAIMARDLARAALEGAK